MNTIKDDSILILNHESQRGKVHYTTSGTMPRVKIIVDPILNPNVNGMIEHFGQENVKWAMERHLANKAAA